MFRLDICGDDVPVLQHINGSLPKRIKQWKSNFGFGIKLLGRGGHRHKTFPFAFLVQNPNTISAGRLSRSKMFGGIMSGAVYKYPII